MKLVRSWPDTIPPRRSYVVDQLHRVVISNYDMSPLAEVGDDVLLIEWDLAVGAEELTAFAEAAGAAPDRVRAAPYRLYTRHSTVRPQDPPIPPAWSAWTYASGNQRNGAMVQVAPGDPIAHVTGFGLIYLPAEILRAYQAARVDAHRHGQAWGFSDVAFCGWHYRCVRPEIDLDWSTRPVHLHYLDEQVRIPGGSRG